MAKSKAQTGVANRHVYTRASYLYQAAYYLAGPIHNKHGVSEQSTTPAGKHSEQIPEALGERATRNLSRQMAFDMRSMSLKGQVRHSSAIKRSVCKYCDSVLVEGQSCRSSVENPSKGGRKPWADVLVIRCLTCSNVKRFLVSARKQPRRPSRSALRADETKEKGCVEDPAPG